MKLIDDCRSKWWRLWSLRWAAIKSTLLAAVLANPVAILDFMRELSRPMRIVVPLAMLVAFLGLDALARLTHQPKVTGHAAAK